MNTTTTKQRQMPSPMRMTRQMLTCLRAGDDRIEYEVLARQVDREQAGIKTATEESRDIDGRLQRVQRAIDTALSDAKTPNVIDKSESEALVRELLGAGIAAHHHVQTMETLS